MLDTLDKSTAVLSDYYEVKDLIGKTNWIFTFIDKD